MSPASLCAGAHLDAEFEVMLTGGTLKLIMTESVAARGKKFYIFARVGLGFKIYFLPYSPQKQRARHLSWYSRAVY